MTGMQLAAKIKEDPSLNHDILLIMLTGISNAPSKIIARNSGVKRILAKPVAGYNHKPTLADELTQRNQGPAVIPPRPPSPMGVRISPHPPRSPAKTMPGTLFPNSGLIWGISTPRRSEPKTRLIAPTGHAA